MNEVMELISTYRERHEGWNVRHYYDHYRDAGGTRSYSWVKNKLQAAGATPKRGHKGMHRPGLDFSDRAPMFRFLRMAGAATPRPWRINLEILGTE